MSFVGVGFICYTSEAIDRITTPCVDIYAFDASMVVPRESPGKSSVVSIRGI